jgi:hypothetical protein
MHQLEVEKIQVGIEELLKCSLGLCHLAHDCASKVLTGCLQLHPFKLGNILVLPTQPYPTVEKQLIGFSILIPISSGSSSGKLFFKATFRPSWV